MTDDLVPQEYDDAEPGWAPRGEHDAEMALRGLERLSARFAAIREQAVVYRADIDAWEQAEIGRLRGRATNLVLGLQAWARDRRLASNHKEKTFRFPSGEISTRTVGSKTEVTDEAALLAWCKAECPDAVKTTETVLRSVVAKAPGMTVDGDRFVREGEIVPGIRFIAGGNWVSAEVKLASERALPPGSQE